MEVSGADTVPPLTFARSLVAWTLDVPVLSVVVVVGVAYLVGVWRVRRSGDSWPVGRTVLFLAGGLGSAIVLTMSCLGTYDRVLFWPYAVQNVLLLSLTPVLLAFGEPVALAGRCLPPRLVDRVRASRVLRVLTFPVVSSLLGAALMLCLYLTPYYDAVLRSDALHELLRLELVVLGCLFFWPMLGGEALPSWCTHPVRVAFGLLDGLVDAVPGLVVMTSMHVIAVGYYVSVRPGWGPSLRYDQQMGGGLMLGLVELVGLPFLAGQFVGWVRADRAEAAALDRRIDELVAERAAAGVEEPELMRPWWETEPPRS
jgi:cytochrome c oxidase assembly factor CtaG